MSCIVGRLLLLKHLFKRAIFNISRWGRSCETILMDIRNEFTKFFPIVYDEAQFHTTYLPQTFPSVHYYKDRSRPFFSVVVRCLSNLSNSFAGAFVCITGSGLSLLRAKDKISGGITCSNL
ncbi:hypothetical protein GLOIN_2v811172 [Rhizophagus irregularis DAOM 181602=DAOM 197198]|nr:hypothetical protein GLOIN_2v811172 [Rhizophagus irregularis DAOM 181602=DAOM 197198]